ncbi:MAG: CoA transferase [Acidimicrobiales bacterium]|nr:CoA transferase [Acidimicrobiales bacterium]
MREPGGSNLGGITSMGLDANRPLGGLKVIESSLLGPGLVATFLADLGADVVKVEPPSGDYIRQMTWPIVDGTSLLHLHTHRGKRSIALDLKTDDGLGIYRDLVREADVVVEAMRPGSLARLGIGFDDLVAVNPQLVFCSVSGYGATGPYRDMPSHGIAYDTWAGLIEPAVDDQGFTRIPTLPNIGINVGPLIGALGILAAVLRARETGKGTWLEVAQSDAAAYMDWYRIETYRAYDRPADVVTGNAADDYERREPGLAGMWEGVRYQIYEASDGHVLFMASEQAFWRNFCEGVNRMDLFEQWPGSTYADHARHNTELQTELKAIFATRTCTEWLDFSNEANTPIAPVNTPRTAPDDPQFSYRLPFYGIEDVGAEQLPLPIYLEGELPPTPTMAPRVGEQTDEVLAELGLSPERIAELRASGAVGPREG